MLCSHPLDYPSDGWLTELTILAKLSSLALLLDYPKTRSLLDRTGDRSRASSLEIELQAFDRGSFYWLPLPVA
jgi:hypothetical protein